jgi:multidrug efflux pump subunit AcrA (membrane-fusion protein)
LLAPGCGGDPKISFTSVSDPPNVTLIKPSVRTITRVVGQPSFVDAYEQTSVYPKMTAYIEKWLVDIGDKVKKDDVLATLFVPELVEEFQTKKADVELAKELIEHAQKLEEVAIADVKAADSRVAEARANLGKFQAEVERWDTEVKRLKREVDRGVVDPEILLESQNQLKSNIASREAAQSTILVTQADLIARQAAAAKSKVDVGVARARLTVADSEAKRLKALVGYLTLTAPFDGVVVARNVNTGDFVLPATGDPSATRRSPDQAPDRSAPLYVVDRTDVLRIYVDIPEQDADFVKIGTKAKVLVRAYRDKEFPASVTRTAWALNVKSRTLRVEIDIPNPESRILPGMYAYGKVIIERPQVRALPLDALVYSGDQTFCWRYENGKAVRMEIETGVSDGDWIEVTNRRATSSQPDPPGDSSWVPVDGSENVILGDLSILTDQAPVKVAGAAGGTKVASAEP